MKEFKFIGWLFAIIVVVGLIFFLSRKDKTETVDNLTSIEGCYVATLAKDVYTLKIESETNGQVTGKLSFKNFEKDSSSGTFAGSFVNGILLGDYEFDSEGMHSVRQVIFKQQGDTFVEGFGEVEVVDNRETLKDTSTVSYDSKLTFKETSSCPI